MRFLTLHIETVPFILRLGGSERDRVWRNDQPMEGFVGACHYASVSAASVVYTGTDNARCHL
jgi:hypothetical protein